MHFGTTRIKVIMSDDGHKKRKHIVLKGSSSYHANQLNVIIEKRCRL